MSNLPPRMLSAPLRLTAMTLRGLGPYLHGARLEIKPLTILCGENGSGKSTWLEALRYLKLASQHESFPLSVDTEADQLIRLGLNETLLQPRVQNVRELKSKRLSLLGELNASGEEDESLRKLHRDEQWGPPGCIGLVLEVVDSTMFSEIDSHCLRLFDEVAIGTVIELRWAFPKLNRVKHWADGFHQWIELVLDGAHILRLQRSLDLETSRPQKKRSFAELLDKQRDKTLTFEGSGEFFGVKKTNGKEPITLGYVDTSGNLIGVASDCEITDSEVIQNACTSFLTLFGSIIRQVIQGFFPIGPVRQILSAQSTTATPFDDVILPDDPEYDRERFEIAQTELDREFAKKRPDQRYVGHDGQNTQDLHGYWAYNLMRQPASSYCGEIPNEFLTSDFTKSSFSPSQLLSDLPKDFQSHVLSLVDPKLGDAWFRVDDQSEKDCTAIQILNSALQLRDLFRREFRPQIANEGRAMIGDVPEVQDERLSSRKLLSDDEVKRVNRLLLEAMFDAHVEGHFKSMPGYASGVYSNELPIGWHRTGYLLETFVSFWMKQLCQTQIQYLSFKGGPLNELWVVTKNGGIEHPPNGGMVDTERNWQPRGSEADKTAAREEAEPDLVETIFPPTTRFSTDWSIMSTGFHQLAPIVVQSGLMRQHEIMSVENPEAHLHPSLQIKVAEFLMHQANAGKVMVIETHSDLFVRRVLRAIRQEHITPGNVFKQSSVATNFTKLYDGVDGIKYAKIEKLEINENGQVHNWPDGFMDDDLKEADCWLASMERQRGLNDE